MRRLLGIKEEKNTPIVSKRLLASFIDWFLGGIFASIPGVIATGMLLHKETLFTDLYIFQAVGYPKSFSYAIGFSCIFLGFLYFVVIPWKILPQQTIGKKILHLKIEGKFGEEPTLKQYLIRQFVCLFFIEGIATNLGLFIKPLITLELEFYVDHYLTIAWSLMTLLSVSLMIYSKKNLAIHDILSNTRVVF